MFHAIKTDYEQGFLTTLDYALFWTTFFLSNRESESESYALQWKHIDFDNNQIILEQTLDKVKNPKILKSRKKSPQQFLFTQCDRKGNINQRLHTDYLNYRMKSIERRHKNLTHATPHKLRHTGATLAKQSGVALEQISEALTHSDINITKTYVNTPNVIQIPIGEIAYRHLSQKDAARNGVNNGVNSKKDASQNELRNA